MPQVRFLTLLEAGKNADHDPDTAELSIRSLVLGAGATPAAVGGGSIKNGLDMNLSTIKNVAPPVNGSDVVTKTFLDEVPKLVPSGVDLAVINNSKLAEISSTSRNGNAQLILLTYSNSNGYTSHTLNMSYNVSELLDVVTRVFLYAGQTWTYSIQLVYNVDDEFTGKSLLQFSKV